MSDLSRRAFVAASAALLSARAFAQESANREDIERPGQLGEKSLGSADAPVTVVEYASMSCPHCAAFDRDTFDAFQKKYIDTGQVRFIFREFPLNAPAYAVAMIARCAPADRFFDIVHTYFRSQAQWLSSGDIKSAILELAKPFGFTQATLDACISNQELFAAIEGVKTRGLALGVQATPTFVINGKKLEGALSLQELEREIEPLLQPQD